MENNHRYLTNDEFLAIQLLAEHKSYTYVKQKCHVSKGRCPSSELSIFYSGIRLKSGIRDLRDAQQCQDYLESYARATAQPPTEEHLKTLRKILGIGCEAHTFEALANNAQCTRAEAEQAWREALRAIGILTHDERQQRVQARLYLASQKPIVTPAIPISDNGWKALRMHAEGRSFEEIARELKLVRPEYARQLVQEGCAKLGIKARGRGVQTKLIRAALAHHDSQQVTMADPMF